MPFHTYQVHLAQGLILAQNAFKPFRTSQMSQVRLSVQLPPHYIHTSYSSSPPCFLTMALHHLLRCFHLFCSCLPISTRIYSVRIKVLCALCTVLSQVMPRTTRMSSILHILSALYCRLSSLTKYGPWLPRLPPPTLYQLY